MSLPRATPVCPGLSLCCALLGVVRPSGLISTVLYLTADKAHCAAPPRDRYPVRMALVDLAQPPAWFSERQSRDHMNVQEARAFAGTDGAV